MSIWLCPHLTRKSAGWQRCFSSEPLQEAIVLRLMLIISLILSAAGLNGGVLAATLETVDEKEQTVSLLLTKLEQKGCCTPGSRLEVHRDGKSIGDFEVMSYSSKTGRVKLSVEEMVKEFTKGPAWTVYLYQGEDGEGSGDDSTSDTTYLSAADRILTFEKLRDNHERLLRKGRTKGKKMNSAERRKLAREVKVAEKLVTEYKEKFFDSAVYRSDKSISIFPAGIVTGFPYAGSGGGVGLVYFVSGDHLVEAIGTKLTGTLNGEREFEVRSDQVALHYRGFLSTTFSYAVGAWYSKYGFALIDAAGEPLEPEPYQAAGLRVGFGNRWQFKYFMVGWDYLDIRIPLYVGESEGKEETMLLTTFAISSLLSAGISL
jgi:hypothetical protein